MTSGHRQRCRSASARGQRGQASMEWGGMLVLVAGIVAVLLTFGLPANVSHAVECAVATALQQHDAACEAAATPPNEVVCTTSTDTSESNTSAKVLFVQVGHDQTLIKTTLSNGAVQYTLTDKDQAQAIADLFGVEVEAGGAGLDLQAQASAGGELNGAHVWQFPNQAAADAFDKQVSGAGGWGQVAHDLLGGIPGAGGLLNLVGVHGSPDPDGLDPNQLAYEYGGVSAIGNLNVNADAGLGPALQAQLNGSLSGAAGARVIENANAANGGQVGGMPLKNGDIQVFVSLSGKGNAALQAALYGPTGSAQGTGVATVTLSPSGQLLQLQVTASADATGGMGGKGTAKSGGGDEAGSGGEGEGDSVAGKLGINLSDGSGNGYSYTGTLNLQNNPQAQIALAEMLGNNPTGVQDMIEQMNSSGTQRVQPYKITRSQGTVGIEGEVADVGGGVSATVSNADQTYQSGWIQTPGGQWEGVICKT